MPISVFSQQEKILILDEIEVSANRINSTLGKTFKSVTVISKEEISSMPVQSVEDILKYFTNVDIRQRGVFGVQADVAIRGGTFEQTLILLNGIKISNPQTAHHNLNLPVNIENIERIEILKGAASRIYGQNAFSGAINIVTKTTKSKNIKLNATIGSYNYSNNNISVSLPIKNYEQLLSYSKKSSTGYISNTDFDITNVFYQSSFKKKINFYAGYTDKKYGANNFYTNLFPWQWETTRTAFLNTSYISKHFESKIYWSQNYDEFVLKRDTPQFYQNIHTTDVIGAELKFNFTTSLGKTSIGAEIINENIRSSNLGNHNRSNVGFYFEQRIIIDKFYITPGTYFCWYSDYNTAFYPGIDIGYYFSPKLEFYAGIGKSYRVPTFTELYYNSPGNIGNTELMPEKAISYELGAKQKNKYFRINASVFKRNSNNLIDWVRKNDTSSWKVQNISKINMFGFEINQKIFLKQFCKTSFPINYLNLKYSFLDANIVDVESITKNTLNHFRHQFILSFENKIFKNVNQVWQIRYEDRICNKAHTLVDSRISYKKNNISLYFEINNIFNVKYFEFGSIEMPGRWIHGGTTININFD